MSNDPWPQTPFYADRLSSAELERIRNSLRRTPVTEQTYEDREQAQEVLNPRRQPESSAPKLATHLEMEGINDLLTAALSAIDIKDFDQAENLIEQARGLVYQHLR